jgi:hypothetical protein
LLSCLVTKATNKKIEALENKLEDIKQVQKLEQKTMDSFGRPAARTPYKSSDYVLAGPKHDKSLRLVEVTASSAIPTITSVECLNEVYHELFLDDVDTAKHTKRNSEVTPILVERPYSRAMSPEARKIIMDRAFSLEDRFSDFHSNIGFNDLFQYLSRNIQLDTTDNGKREIEVWYTDRFGRYNAKILTKDSNVTLPFTYKNDRTCHTLLKAHLSLFGYIAVGDKAHTKFMEPLAEEISASISGLQDISGVRDTIVRGLVERMDAHNRRVLQADQSTAAAAPLSPLPESPETPDDSSDSDFVPEDSSSTSASEDGHAYSSDEDDSDGGESFIGYSDELAGPRIEFSKDITLQALPWFRHLDCDEYKKIIPYVFRDLVYGDADIADFLYDTELWGFRIELYYSNEENVTIMVDSQNSMVMN